MCPDLRLYDDTEQKLASDPTVGRIPGAVVAETALANPPGGVYAGSESERIGVLFGYDNASRPAATQQGANGQSDASLTQLARSALAKNGAVPTGKVRPVVRNAWLILEGEVEARVQRHAAEESVKGLPGIRGISNNLLIESEVMAQRVSRKIDEAFIRNARLSANRVSVTACNHKIILSGSVHSGVERDAAETAAWGVPGVAHVVNRIRAIA